MKVPANRKVLVSSKAISKPPISISAKKNEKEKRPKKNGRDEEKEAVARSLIVARLDKQVARQKERMQKFGGVPETNLATEAPLYHLIGPARAALAHYRPPNFQEAIKPVNLMIQFKNRLWEHEEGRKLLDYLLELAIAYNNTLRKTRKAVETFEEILSYDPLDHLNSRYSYLRCLMDNAMGQSARKLIEIRFPEDRSACFMYSLALLEHISMLLGENNDDTSTIKDSSFRRAFDANPFIAFLLLYYNDLDGFFEQLDTLPKNCEIGSIEEALEFYRVDLVLWKDTDGALDWVRNYCSSANINYVSISAIFHSRYTDKSNMFVSMFSTACDMIKDMNE